jgi:hypothetical protein
MRRCLAVLALAMLLASCHHLAPLAPAVTTHVRFYLESLEPGAQTETLPQSGVQIGVRSQPLLTEADVKNVEIGQLDLGQCLLFQLTPDASAALNRVAIASRGRRLVLTVNDVALGAKRIDAPIGANPLAVFVEVPDAYLPRLLAMLKPTDAISAGRSNSDR